MRALEDMLEYDFDVEYLPGAKDYVQDALSRRPDYQEPPIPRMMQMSATRQANAEIELFQLMLDDGEEWITAIRKGYETDPYCQDILAYLQPSPTSSRVDSAPPQKRDNIRTTVDGRKLGGGIMSSAATAFSHTVHPEHWSSPMSGVSRSGSYEKHMIQRLVGTVEHLVPMRQSRDASSGLVSFRRLNAMSEDAEFARVQSHRTRSLMDFCSH
jgi:hypothetical protein